MTDERDKSAPIVDETVSRTYREIAGERAPERLDRAILAEAARAARPRYARSRAWTRPLAWAATIALSVAIVLELTQVPTPEDAAFELETPAFDDEFSDAPAGMGTAPAEEAAPASVAPGRSNDVLPETPEKTSLMQKTSTPMASEAVAEERERQVAEPESSSEPAAAPVGAARFDEKDTDLLRRADEMAETRSLNAREEKMVTLEQAARLQGVALGDVAEGCPEAMRHDPEDWFECIEGLQEAGLEAQADEQRRLLQEAFPAFEIP